MGHGSSLALSGSNSRSSQKNLTKKAFRGNKRWFPFPQRSNVGKLRKNTTYGYGGCEPNLYIVSPADHNNASCLNFDSTLDASVAWWQFVGSDGTLSVQRMLRNGG